MKFKNGALKATRSREGMEVQVENTSDAIKKALLDKKAAEKGYHRGKRRCSGDTAEVYKGGSIPVYGSSW